MDAHAVRRVAMGASFAVGGATVVQSRINGALGKVVGDGIFAAWISFSVGLIVVLAFVSSVPSQRAALGRLRLAVRKDQAGNRGLRRWELFGGLGGATFVAAQSTTVQFIGVALFTVSVVAGQNANSLLVDRFGLGPAGVQRFTATRVVAAIVATVGVIIAVAGNFQSASFEIWPIAFALFAGALIAVQQAINGKVAAAAGSPWGAGTTNFTVGWFGLTIALLVGHLISPHGWTLPVAPWHNPILWSGGLIGVAFIVVAASTVRTLGVLLFTLLAIAGQVTGALMLDWLWPVAGTKVSLTLVIGVFVTAAAVALAALGRTRPRGA